MKHTSILITGILLLFSPLALADHFETLAGYGDSVEICKGEAALVIFANDAPIVKYHRKGKRPVQFRLGIPRSRAYYTSRYGIGEDSLPSAERPLVLVGPASISLVTDGVISIEVIESRFEKGLEHPREADQSFK